MIIGISGKIGSGKDTVARIIQYLTYPERSAPYSIENWLDLRYGIAAHHPMNTWEIKKFAGKLKQMVSLLTGIPMEDLEKQEVKDSYLGKEWDKYEYATLGSLQVSYYDEGLQYAINAGWEKLNNGDYRRSRGKYTVREMLQKLGTEALRDIIHPNVHVNALFADYKCEGNLHEPRWTNSGYPNWLISDLRFPNEAQAVIDRGGINIRINRPKEQEWVDTANGVEAKVEHPSETALDNYTGFKYKIINDGSIEDLVKKVRQILISEQII